MLLVTHPSFSSEFSFLPETCWCTHAPATLFVCLFCSEAPWSLETHNEMGVVSEQTCIELTLSPAPSAHQESREENIIVRGTKWNQLIELWHSSRGMVKHHGISVYKIEGENIQQKIQKPTIPCEILFLNQKSRAFSETWFLRYLTFHRYIFFSCMFKIFVLIQK